MGRQTYQVGPWRCPSCEELSDEKHRCTECRTDLAGASLTTGRETLRKR